MKSSAILLRFALAGLALMADAAGAVVVQGAAPPAARSPRATVAARARPPANPISLVEGQITAVDRGRRTLTIGAQTFALHPQRLRVFGTGAGTQSADALAPGMRVRFAAEPEGAEPRRIVLIYIDRRP